MAAHRHLKNAPVKEALIDIQFQPPVALELVEKFVAAVGPEYPKQSAIWQAFVNFAGNDGAAPVASSNHAKMGVRLDSEDGRFVLQAKSNGLTVSRLNPYGQWSDLKGETQRWWDLFSKLISPQVVTKLAVRYINTIELPLPLQDFSDFLVSAPTVPPELPQGLTSFLYRVEFPDYASETMAVVTQALEQIYQQPDGTIKLPVVLDIEVNRNVGIEDPSSEVVWEALNDLRDRKNAIFFAYITERTAEMFE